ncbi:MAG: fibronectin type III domain-containing protein, partial [bacterium]
KQILALSDYNEEAADDQDSHHLNNNPWQMIYLFDGNPDTKVVCAGYTKAFQYLCDQTSFQNKAIYALSVTGTLTYDAEARPHAWNLVHMDDGMNYLVDLTNTQEDSLFLRGAKGSVKEGYTLEANGMEMTYTYHQKETIAIYQTSELSLSADDYQHAEHSHVYGDPVVIRQPSYGVEGLKQQTCEICGGTKTEVIPALDLIDLNSDEVEITMKSEQTYTGEALKPKPVLKCQGKTLKLNAHYSLSYKDNTNVGLATLTIKGLDIYRGKVVKTFKINPKPTAITKVTAGKKRFTVKWKKQTKQTTGYQIQYGLNSTLTDHQSKLIKKNKTVSLTIKKLKSKKKYYVRIRTYKKIGSTYYYSSFSQTKSIKTK